jgi:SAM-dependent methyltransferase
MSDPTKLDLETIQFCPACKSEAVQPYVTIPTGRLGNLRYSLYYGECQKCGLIFQHNRIAESSIAEFYKTYYRGAAYRDGIDNNPPSEAEEASAHLRASIDVDFMRHFADPQPKSVLDVGCGQAWAGFELEADTLYVGVESNSFGHEFKRCKSWVVDTLADLNSDPFDLVMASHVLEHVHYPVKFLESLLPHLVDGGSIMIDVPNAKVSPSGFGFPHLLGFDAHSLTETLKLAGLEVYKIAAHGANGSIVSEIPFNLIALAKRRTE